MSNETRANDSLLNRRTLLSAGAALGGSILLSDARAAQRAQVPSAPGGDAGKVTAYAFESQVWIRADGRPFTTYRANPAQKYPYFYPLLGPATGLPMTEEAGEQYPHHRSLFLGCDRMNGGNYWQEGLDRGQIVSRGPKVDPGAAAGLVIADTCDWRQPGKDPIARDERKWTIAAPTPDVRLIDADITLHALTDLRVEKTNHSLFSIRAAIDITPARGGQLVDSEGRSSEKGTFGQAAAWCGFSGTRLGQTESIVLMDHPGNPWSPCRWFTRDYGFMSPTPFNWLEADGWQLAQGKSARLRYRVAVLGGPIARDRVQSLFEGFART